jgi:hypothetical protein
VQGAVEQRWRLRSVLVLVAALAWAAPAAAQSVTLKFRDGLVTLVAENASIRQILAEWTRLGGTRFVDADRVSSAPVTLELVDVPERQAIDVLLRDVSGYIAAARQSAPGASALASVFIVPTSSVPRPLAAVSSSPPVAAPGPPTLQPGTSSDAGLDADAPPDGGDGPADPSGRAVAGAPPSRALTLQEREALERSAQSRDSAGRVVAPVSPPFQAEQPLPAEPPQPTTLTVPPNPFGIRTGSSRPGVISPVPQPQNQENRPNR